jgi:hypothetical protein
VHRLALFILNLLIVLTLLLARGGGALQRWNNCNRIVQEQGHNIARPFITYYLIGERSEAWVTKQPLLDGLLLQLSELGDEQLLWCWKLPLLEL